MIDDIKSHVKYIDQVNQEIDEALKHKENFHVNDIFRSQDVIKLKGGDQNGVQTESDGELQSQ